MSKDIQPRILVAFYIFTTIFCLLCLGTALVLTYYLVSGVKPLEKETTAASQKF